VIVSEPAAVAVSVKVASPVELVVTGVALIVLPFADVIATLVLAMGLPAESTSVAVYVPAAPMTRLEGPLRLSLVPMTLTVTVAFVEPANPVTVICRSLVSPPVLRLAEAVPVDPVVPFVTSIAPEDAVNVTGTPETTLLLESCTSAVMVAGVEPSDGICGELESIEMVYLTAGGAPLPLDSEPVSGPLPVPQPASTRAAAAAIMIERNLLMLDSTLNTARGGSDPP
jgi:hypothetical protein